MAARALESPRSKRPRTEGAEEQLQQEESDPVITLDVGGTVMKTRRSTLTWGSVYFRNLYSCGFKAADSHLFLDCDPSIFVHVLHYFRHRKLRANAPLEDVRDVASLFSIDALLEEVDRLLEVQRMVGLWKCKRSDLETLFIIYEREGSLWYYEDQTEDDPNFELPPTVHAKLHKNGEYYVLPRTKDDPRQDSDFVTLAAMRLKLHGAMLACSNQSSDQDDAPWDPETLAFKVSTTAAPS
eukprot:TRINITY_DN121838_c0_g1_i1.p1 TRINITY_DN121838_c0_g1~~TRINITY_DN121838_c0_g1_i1.p1  ORF type:complete len:240 (+),score=25.15 TRINITY_DN121838_c0_g1_i1:61-780(+)